MTEIVLCSVLIATNALWAYLVFRLTDRLMSRNYMEFVQAKAYGRREPEKTAPDTLVEDPIDQIQAQEMNAMIGIV